AYSTPGNGPFPQGGIIGPLYSWFPFHVYDYSWVVGLVAAFLCYLALSALFPAAAARRRPQAAAPTQPRRQSRCSPHLAAGAPAISQSTSRPDPGLSRA